MRLLLMVAWLLPAIAVADEAPRWMRTISVMAVDAPEGESREDWLAAGFNGARDVQACSELLPEVPEAAEELQLILSIGLWEDGRVRDLSVSGDDVAPGARQCVEDVARRLRFPEAPDRSDERTVPITVRVRWTRARLELLAVSDEVRSAVLDVPEPTIEGHIDAYSLVAQIGSIQDALARCVSKRRKKVPDMGNRMDVRIRLSRDPEDWTVRVDSMVVVQSDLGDEAAEVCVLRQLKKVEWPPPNVGGHAQIVWPFVFAD
jgi:hypothetical protein